MAAPRPSASAANRTPPQILLIGIGSSSGNVSLAINGKTLNYSTRNNVPFVDNSSTFQAEATIKSEVGLDPKIPPTVTIYDTQGTVLTSFSMIADSTVAGRWNVSQNIALDSVPPNGNDGLKEVVVTATDLSGNSTSSPSARSPVLLRRLRSLSTANGIKVADDAGHFRVGHAAGFYLNPVRIVR